ncbi:MAG: hypothetical protein AAGA42_20130 [Actinomycetota bacterium]
MADDDVSFAVATYRYLRLAIVVVLTALIASVLIERANAPCWLGSLSAYYYTPVQPIFVGALISIGVSFVAIKGSSTAEDIALNVAGVVAPIVAIVPTDRPRQVCASSELTLGDERAFINNNVVALIIAGAVAIGIGWWATRRSRGQRPEFSSIVGLGVALVMLVGGAAWYWLDDDSFFSRAHGVAAVVMFLALWVTMLINAVDEDRQFRTVYWGTAVAMVLVAVAVGIGWLVDRHWQHKILVLELFELAPVVVFWAVQTVEHWDGGDEAAPEMPYRSVG